MENLQDIFMDEATDLINDLEKAILSLEKNPGDKEHIQEVFRVMHTLKGNCSMFGFDKIADFLHQLETIYDHVRTQKIELTNDIVNLTLLSVDHLKLLLNDPGLTNNKTQKTHDNIFKQVIKVTDEIISPPREDLEGAGGEERPSTWYIQFCPNENILKTGVNPLYLLEEIHTLGACKVIPYTDNIPALDEIELSQCYTFWEVFLATTEDKKAIEHIFIFAEDESIIKIHHLSETNLLINKEFISKVEESPLHSTTEEGLEIRLAELQEFIANAKPSLTPSPPLIPPPAGGGRTGQPLSPSAGNGHTSTRAWETDRSRQCRISF
ncbi:MAG: Hpt domain-containing protein [Bacteroidetes bacterium]|nr:Hpt domain-containing protein [Bacteroidota bacterium]